MALVGSATKQPLGDEEIDVIFVMGQLFSKCYHCQLSAAWWIFSSFSFFKKMLKDCHIQAFSPSKGHNFVLKKHAGPLP